MGFARAIPPWDGGGVADRLNKPFSRVMTPNLVV